MAGRALDELRWRFQVFTLGRRYHGWRVWRWFFGAGPITRPAYCCICGCWSWSTWERAPYSSGCGYLCEDCAEDNDRGLEGERQDVYGGY